MLKAAIMLYFARLKVMVKILSIQASPRHERSVSRTLSAELLKLLTEKVSAIEVVVRDLITHPAPLLTDGFVTAIIIQNSPAFYLYRFLSLVITDRQEC